MNKTELIRHISETNTISIKKATQIVNIVLGAVSDAINKDGLLVIPDFGRFRVTKVKGFKTVFPNTDKIIYVPPKERISFKPYKRFLYYSKYN